MTNEWEPEVFFYSVGGLEHHEGKFYDTLQSHGIVVEKPCPVPIEELQKFLKDTMKQLGIPCRLVSCSYVERCLSGEIEEEQQEDY